MKRIIYYIALMATMLAVTSCVEPFDYTIPGQDFTLQFSCGVMTKADVDGVSNENLIKQIDYFIFPLNLDEDNKMVGSTKYVLTGTVTPTDNGLNGSYSTVLSHSDLATIFPDGATKAMVFAVANYVDQYGANNDMAAPYPHTTIPRKDDNDEYLTWDALHSLEVGPTFFYDDQDPDFLLRWPRKLDPDDDNLFFVMTGEKAIELQTPTAEIPLERLASKVTISFTYEEFTDDKSIKWIPQTDDGDTRVYLSNAIEHTTLGGPLTRDLVKDSWDNATWPLGNGTRDIFEYAYDYMKDIVPTPTPTEENPNAKTKIAHYYTYPISMKEGDDNQPYIKLVLPWYGYKYYGSELNPTFNIEDPNWRMVKEKEVYYKVVLPYGTVSEGNMIYEYTVTVNIIGSEKEVALIGEYKIKDWDTKDPVSSSVATGRYISLDIPKDNYDMYVDEIDISFVSSGTVIPIVREIYQLNYSSATTGKDYFMQNDAVTATTALKTDKGLTNEDIEGWVSIPNETSYLKIKHSMDNNMLNDAGTGKNSAFDMAPYVFVVTLHLEAAGDDTSFDRTVTITQYPSLCVTSRVSNGFTFVNNRSNATAQYTICYDDRGQNYNYHLGNIRYQAGTLTGTGDNDNPNNYIITTSTLAGTNYILGDPRSSVDNLSNLEGLTNYRPTSATGTENMIAPKLLVASSYGVISYYASDYPFYGDPTYYVDLTAAKKRCAAYQESGYPAGRWRVPTAAEIIFMTTLSQYDFIPSLFNFYATEGTNGLRDEEGYWSANGKIIGTRTSTSEPFKPSLNTAYNGTPTAVRCVYDAWYWGEEPYQDNATTWLGYKDK